MSDALSNVWAQLCTSIYFLWVILSRTGILQYKGSQENRFLASRVVQFRELGMTGPSWTVQAIRQQQDTLHVALENLVAQICQCDIFDTILLPKLYGESLG